MSVDVSSICLAKGYGLSGGWNNYLVDGAVEWGFCSAGQSDGVVEIGLVKGRNWRKLGLVKGRNRWITACVFRLFFFRVVTFSMELFSLSMTDKSVPKTLLLSFKCTNSNGMSPWIWYSKKVIRPLRTSIARVSHP